MVLRFTSAETAGGALSWTSGVDARDVPSKALLEEDVCDCGSDSGKPTSRSTDADTDGAGTGAPVWVSSDTLQGPGDMRHCQEMVGEMLCMTRAAKQRWSEE